MNISAKIIRIALLSAGFALVSFSGADSARAETPTLSCPNCLVTIDKNSCYKKKKAFSTVNCNIEKVVSNYAKNSYLGETGSKFKISNSPKIFSRY